MNMKKYLVVLVLLLSCYSCSPVRGESSLPNIDEFKQDITSINVKLWGSLSRYDYNNDLSKMDYKTYLKHIEELKLLQSERLIKAIQESDNSIFESEKEEFYVCFRSEKLVYVLCDRASTVGADEISRELPLKTERILLEQLKTKKSLNNPTLTNH